MAEIVATQELYDSTGDVVAKPGDTVEVRDDTARWYVERGAATWPPKAKASTAAKDTSKDTKKEEG